jgi:hypothetical protein
MPLSITSVDADVNFRKSGLAGSMLRNFGSPLVRLLFADTLLEGEEIESWLAF